MIESAVQKALYTALSTALTGVADVYDSVPQKAAYPYVVIESHEITPTDGLTNRREVRHVYLSVWSQYRGQKEVLDILSTVDSALHRQKLELETGRLVIAFVDNKRTAREPDNMTFQGAAKIRLITEQ